MCQAIAPKLDLTQRNVSHNSGSHFQGTLRKTLSSRHLGIMPAQIVAIAMAPHSMTCCSLHTLTPSCCSRQAKQLKALPILCSSQSELLSSNCLDIILRVQTSILYGQRVECAPTNKFKDMHAQKVLLLFRAGLCSYGAHSNKENSYSESASYSAKSLWL